MRDYVMGGLLVLALVLMGCASPERAQTEAGNACSHLAGQSYGECYALVYNSSLNRQSATSNAFWFGTGGGGRVDVDVEAAPSYAVQPQRKMRWCQQIGTYTHCN